jgi:serpin B
LVDFRRGAEAARAEINRWVSDRTKGRISDVLAPGSPDGGTRLVLVNAVYFKGKWRVPFDKDRTRDETFFLENGGEVRVPLMHQSEHVGYRQGPGYQAITLPYQGTDLSLLVLLPDRRDGLGDLETKLSAAMINECLQVRGTSQVELFLPRFTITWGTVELGDALATLGMRLALTREADFSGVNGRAPPDEESLFLSSVFHKAFVDVNEEGTEAAAATAAEMIASGLYSRPPPVPIFRADHPFLFAICDGKTGAIIFLGRMLDPTRPT